MNEQELRDGLRDTMAASSPPPSMNPTEALDTAKRAHKRRRATWAGLGAGATVVALAAGTVFALTPSGESLPIDAATGGVPTHGNGPVDTTKTTWPNNQPDRTQHNGPQADKAAGVLATLKAALPDTLKVDENLTHQGSGNKVTMSQAQFANYYGPGNQQQAWEYAAVVSLTRAAAPNGGHGHVIVQVNPPGNEGSSSTDVCTLASAFWSSEGPCQTRVVQGKTVGVTTKGERASLDNVAAYRYEDGTVVWVAQSKDASSSQSTGSMSQPPLTADQLAQLALNPAFKVK
ncbi:hypothetical protein ALI144C_23910 [Actinosynnema sp. ALI-1.44]|uniref:hypothetical protein n=1 Tax=Actinosynnema sp. ALI-1.44 TaxID=1933779 RepID=UPI00097BA92D|nr:hypothetical protein [Actinosynnema sp. ALI-1.44]ONI79790.1 hypothetical protein ALI144C_23910 [Actinosynnema sp. ALI-1.44]